MPGRFPTWEVRWRTYERGRVFGYLVKARTAGEAYDKASRKFDAEVESSIVPDARHHWWLSWGAITKL